MFLFYATDAGGAKELRAVALEAKRQGERFSILCSPTAQFFFAEVGLDAEKKNFASVQEAQDVLRSLSVTVIFVGTTGTQSGDRLLTLAARELQIPSVAVLDEWYWYTLRFSDHGKLTLLPNAVCVQDAVSKKLAIADGLPAGILHVTGSPGLTYLSDQAKRFRPHPPAVPHCLHDLHDRPSLLFLSDRVKRAYGSAPGERGILGTYLGYDEDTVRADIADVLSSQNRAVLLLEKLHPAEPPKPPPALAPHVEWRVLPSEEPLLPLLIHGDHILGMTTKALLETAVLGKKPISYQPNALRDPKELCTAVRFGTADLCLSKDALADCIFKRLHGADVTEMPPVLPAIDPASPDNVLTVGRKMIADKA